MSDQSTLLLEHQLKELKLPTFLREYGKLAAQCAAEGVSHPDYLLRLAEVELTDRHQRMVQRRIRAARFPATKGLDTFDFSAIPSVRLGCASPTETRPRARWRTGSSTCGVTWSRNDVGTRDCDVRARNAHQMKRPHLGKLSRSPSGGPQPAAPARPTSALGHLGLATASERGSGSLIVERRSLCTSWCGRFMIALEQVRQYLETHGPQAGRRSPGQHPGRRNKQLHPGCWPNCSAWR